MMRSIRTRPSCLLFSLACLSACGEAGGDTGDTTADPGETTGEPGGTTTAAPETTDTPTTGADDTAPTTGGSSGTATETGEPAGRGLPEGVSTWKGQGELEGYTVPLELTLTNTNGDLTASVTITDPPDQPIGFGTSVLSATGTHEPTSGLIALAPDVWTTLPVIMIEIPGFLGSYDPDAGRLSGVIADYARSIDNTVWSGPATFDLVDGPGEPTVPGAAEASIAASQNVTGTSQCAGAVRDVAGVLEYDGAGAVTGRITLGDPELATPFGSFAVSGVHNPSTGGVTLAPGIWLELPPDTSAPVFIDGTVDPATKKFDGDTRNPVASCVPDGWHAMLE